MISIILRVKNEMPWLKYTLKLLAKQSRQDFEVIAVDSGSEDGSWELLQEYKPSILYQIEPASYIPGRVLNDAITKASGEIIVFNNADCIPMDEYWLENLLKPFEESDDIVAVYANQIARPNAIPLVKKDYERAFGDGSLASGWRHFFSLASSAVRRSIITQYPFNPDIQYSEDTEWSWRMKNMGYKIQYVPDAIVQHSHNYSLKEIKKRYYGEGRAEAVIYQQYYQEHPQDLKFLRSVLLAALAEYVRDLLYLMKNKEPGWIIKAFVYRFFQRLYAFKGRSEGLAKDLIAVSCLAFDGGKSGISEYTVSVVKELAKTKSLLLFGHQSDRILFPVEADNIRWQIVPEFFKKPLLSMLWHLYYLPVLLRILGLERVFLPAGNRRLLARYPAKSLVTFHDLSQFHIPGKYDAFRMLYIRHIVPFYLKKAPAIHAISENTKQDMLKYYHFKPERIQVNYNGFDATKLDKSLPRERLAEKYGIRGKYILYMARIEHPGKNHLNLLKAYALLPEALKEEYALVLGGGDWNNAETVHSYHAQMPDRQRVYFTGFVQDADLAAFYLNASLYVFPSFYEGFGLPILEAFAAKVPVICANTSALPEIGGDAVLTFDPNQPKDMAAVMSRVLDDNELQTELIQKGERRLQDFSWQRHADAILRAFEEL